jgi:hypothetical protein
MLDNITIISIVIIIIALYYIFSNTNEGFYRPLPIWNISTRLPKLYYDIRGNPNIAYRQLMYSNTYLPFGYIFGPNLYDAQGNLIPIM